MPQGGERIGVPSGLPSSFRPLSEAGDAAPVIQITPTEGGGPRPILAWEGADGASSYFVVVKDDEGAAYWAWEGSETSIPLGGAEFPQDHGNGPTIGPGYTWSVSAYAGDGTFLAISGDRPISP